MYILFFHFLLFANGLSLLLNSTSNIIQNKNNIILSSGVIASNRSQLQEQYNQYKVYTNMGIISSSSILVYNLDINGNLDTYATSDPNTTAENYQNLLKKDFNLTSIPCLYCDATIGHCSDLGLRLDKLYTHEEKFINNTLNLSIKNNYDGFIVDFEPDNAIFNWTQLTNFLINWAINLKTINIPLYVWVGGGTQYDDILFTSDNIILVTMDTYVSSYSGFVEVASNLVDKVDSVRKIGFGLLTSEDMPEDDMVQLIKWCKITNITILNIWASTISGLSFKGLHKFLDN